MISKHLLFVLFSIFGIFPLFSQNYIIDPGHTSVTSSVQRFGAVNVVGRFKDVTGNIQYNAEDVSSTLSNVIIKVDSYDANNAGGEAAVKSQAFLHAEQYPEIRFVGKKAVKKEDGLYAIGELTIHGTTKEIEFPFRIIGPVLDMPTQKQSIAVIAELTINRQDYGVSFDRKLPDGSSLIGNEVKINLNVLAVEE